MKYINFNNAGSSRPHSGINKIIFNFLELERKYGGYYAAEKFSKELGDFYNNLSNLINCNKEEISFLSNTTLAWNLFFNSLNISKKHNVVIFENEYGSNLIYYRKQNLNLRIVKIKEDGNICLNDLRQKIDENTKIVCLCHIASQCGDEMCAERVGNLIYNINPKIIFILDACQSIGQVKVDVKKIKCDVLVGSGRKYLRGPRGTGFIFVKKQITKKIQPSILDLKNAELKENYIKIRKSNVFENFEYSPALKLGLSKAIENTNITGIEEITSDIKKKSLFLRRKLEKFDEIIFYENHKFITGINTLRIRGYKSSKLQKYLLSKKILSSTSSLATSFLYFRKKRISDVLRVSIHRYNSLSEINYLVKCLIDLIKKKVII